MDVTYSPRPIEERQAVGQLTQLEKCVYVGGSSVDNVSQVHMASFMLFIPSASDSL